MQKKGVIRPGDPRFTNHLPAVVEFLIPTIIGKPSGINRVISPAMLGDEIRKARLKAGLTQEELAFRAGVSRQYVSLLELNQESPTVDLLIRVCKVMGASAGKIVVRIEKAA
jgi:DNA-binding XRE family transcriptional regulator